MPDAYYTDWLRVAFEEAHHFTLLDAHLRARMGAPPRIAVWEHNSHLGDARATEFNRTGEWNVGQLVRERHPGETYLVGFTTYAGKVRAASAWSLSGSW